MGSGTSSVHSLVRKSYRHVSARPRPAYTYIDPCTSTAECSARLGGRGPARGSTLERVRLRVSVGVRVRVRVSVRVKVRVGVGLGLG